MIVYWGIYDPKQFLYMNHNEPSKVIDCLNEMKIDSPPRDNFKNCPAVRDQFRNVFRLQLPFDNDLEISETQLKTSRYDQEFFNNMINVRSLTSRLLSFNLSYTFVCEESLEIESTGCWFSQNDFVNKTMVIPGKFNIGKWVRPLDCAFLVKENVNSIKLNMGDDYSYVKFNTDEQIVLKKFYITDTFRKIVASNMKSRDYKIKPIEKLIYYYRQYERSKMHKLIMREIKNNLME